MKNEYYDKTEYLDINGEYIQYTDNLRFIPKPSRKVLLNFIDGVSFGLLEEINEFLEVIGVKEMKRMSGIVIRDGWMRTGEMLSSFSLKTTLQMPKVLTGALSLVSTLYEKMQGASLFSSLSLVGVNKKSTCRKYNITKEVENE